MRNLTYIILIFTYVSCTISKSKSLDDLVKITYEQIKNEDWEKAEKNLDELIRRDPNNGIFYFKRGFVKEKNLKYRECISDFTKVIELLPEKHVTRTNRGYAYRKLGEYDKVIQDFNDELLVNPNAASYEHLSMVYYLKEDYERALENVNISIKKKPYRPIPYKTRALIYKAIFNKEEACSDMEKSVELDLLVNYPNYSADIADLKEYCSE